MYFPGSYQNENGFHFHAIHQSNSKAARSNGDNLQLVADSSKRMLTLVSDKLKFVGHADSALCEILRNV